MNARWWTIARPRSSVREDPSGGVMFVCYAGAPPLDEIGATYAPTQAQAAMLALSAFPRAGLTAQNIVVELAEQEATR